MGLQKTQPWLIQRCYFDRENKKLRYEYMGSSEFEFGDQATSLKRMFNGEIEIHCCTVKVQTSLVHERPVEFRLVARKDFDFDSYTEVLQGLIERQWQTKEETYLEPILEKVMGFVDDERNSYIQTEVWFDFKNDVLFTLSQENADLLVVILANIKEHWRIKEKWRNSPPIRKFNNEVDKLRKRLNKVMSFVYLGSAENMNGRPKVHLNDGGISNSGWYTLKQLQNFTSHQERKFKRLQKPQRTKATVR